MIGKERLKIFFWKCYLKLLPTRDQRNMAKSIQRFREKMMDPKFDWKPYANRVNPYFERFGFKFSALEGEYYAACTGVKSDLYIPMTLYDDFLYPYLNPQTWRLGYCDKNMFSRLLNISEAQQHVDIEIPEYIVYCDFGRYFLPNDRLCTRQEAVNAVCSCKQSFIIKPTVGSEHGQGIRKFEKDEINESSIETLFSQYGDNFTIQKVIRQHPDLAAFNPTSVNTIRITTYQDFKGEVKVLYASQRFGGKDKVFDNADDPNGSGGFCAILPDGTVKREVHRYRNLKVVPLDDNIPEKIPCYDKVVKAVKFLHTRFPQFGLIGWDMTVTPEGHPLMIEYNFCPGLGTGQLAHGPIFPKEDLDEIMSRVSNCRYRYVTKALVSYPDKKHNFLMRNI